MELLKPTVQVNWRKQTPMGSGDVGAGPLKLAHVAVKGKDWTVVACGGHSVFMVKPVITVVADGLPPVGSAFSEHTAVCVCPGSQFAPTSTPSTLSGAHIVPNGFTQPIPIMPRDKRPLQRTRLVPARR